MKTTRVVLFCAPILLSGGLWGQVPLLFPSASSRIQGDTLVVTFRGGPRFLGGAIRGAPYSGDYLSDHTQTLADGTHISQSNPTERVSRDSEGRTRTERPFPMAPLPQRVGKFSMIEIADPVAGFAYVLDDVNRVAHRIALPQRPQMGGAGVSFERGAPAATSTAPAPDPSRPQFSTEKLGTQMIEGLIADGTRTTTTWPVGAQGNDRPLVDTSEHWLSTELKVTVLSKSSSARNGESTMKLINISRTQPDAALFQPPPDYTIADEKDSFTVTLKRQQ